MRSRRSSPSARVADALASDRRRAAGTVGAFEGIPITVKDWIDVAGWPIAGSAVEHRDRRPERDATAVARLRAAGAVVVGITTALADSPAHGRTQQPGDADACARRIVVGCRGRGRGRRRGARARQRLGRQHPAARGLVRRVRLEADVRPRPAHRPLPAPRRAVRRADGDRPARKPRRRPRGRALAASPVPTDLDAASFPSRSAIAASGRHLQLRIGTVDGGDPDHVARAVDQLRDAGATIVDDAIPDVRDEALDITRRYWKRAQPSPGPDNATLLWDWDRFRRRMLVATRRSRRVGDARDHRARTAWRESIETDYVWQLPWSLTGAPAVVVPAGTDASLPLSVQIVGRRFEDHVLLALAAALGP